MKSSGSVLNVYIISSLEVGHHPLCESHVKVGLHRVLDVTLIKILIREHELNLQFVYNVIYLLV